MGFTTEGFNNLAASHSCTKNVPNPEVTAFWLVTARIVMSGQTRLYVPSSQQRQVFWGRRLVRERKKNQNQNNIAKFKVGHKPHLQNYPIPSGKRALISEQQPWLSDPAILTVEENQQSLHLSNFFRRKPL